MSTTTSTYHKVIRNRRVLVAGLIILLSLIVITGFVWMQTDHVIAPPGLRIMNAFWTLFICRCPPL
jgi:hypothetical protein